MNTCFYIFYIHRHRNKPDNIEPDYTLYPTSGKHDIGRFTLLRLGHEPVHPAVMAHPAGPPLPLGQLALARPHEHQPRVVRLRVRHLDQP